MIFSKCLFLFYAGKYKDQPTIKNKGRCFRIKQERRKQKRGRFQKEKERMRQHLERDFQVLFLCGGSVKVSYEKTIRELPALKICFADGGQVGNQFAAQIGYI